MAQLLSGSTKAYYAWLVREPEPSRRSCSDGTAFVHPYGVYDLRGTFGAARIHAQLAREGVQVANINNNLFSITALI
jgi:hypothetical protein